MGAALELPFEFRVAGTGYDRRYSTIRRYCAKRSPLRLTPEADNAVDPHAIAIHLGWVNAAGREMWDQIGYVPADLSPFLHRLIGSGEWALENVFVRRFDASPELDAPRVIARLEGIDLRQPRAEPPATLKGEGT